MNSPWSGLWQTSLSRSSTSSSELCQGVFSSQGSLSHLMMSPFKKDLKIHEVCRILSKYFCFSLLACCHIKHFLVRQFSAEHLSICNWPIHWHVQASCVSVVTSKSEYGCLWSSIKLFKLCVIILIHTFLGISFIHSMIVESTLSTAFSPFSTSLNFPVLLLMDKHVCLQTCIIRHKNCDALKCIETHTIISYTAVPPPIQPIADTFGILNPAHGPLSHTP